MVKIKTSCTPIQPIILKDSQRILIGRLIMPILLIGPEYSTQSERRNKGRRRCMHSNDRTYLMEKVVIKPKNARHFHRENVSHSLDGVFVI
jgi:hypothetical protein